MKIEKRVLYLILILILIAGCASSALMVHELQSFPEPNDKQGLIYFYRLSKFSGAAISYDINLGNQKIGGIQNGTYFYRFVDPGTYQIWAKTESKSEIILDVEPKSTYYVKCSVGFGVLMGRPKLTLVHEVTGKSEIRNCKYATMKVGT